MVIKNIVWDWNGTIINDAYLFVEIMNVLLEKQSLPLINLNDYKNVFCFPIQKYWEKIGFKFNKGQFNKMNSLFITLYQQRMQEPLIQKGLIDVLKVLSRRNIKQYVLSASEHKILNKMVEYYNLKKYFKDVVGVNNLNAEGKEELGASLLKKHNLNPRETVLIGDTEYDLRVAKNIGCRCILVSYGHFNLSRLTDLHNLVIDDSSHILQQLT